MGCCEEGFTLATIACTLVNCLSREEGELLSAELEAVADLIDAIYSREDCCKSRNSDSDSDSDSDMRYIE